MSQLDGGPRSGLPDFSGEGASVRKSTFSMGPGNIRISRRAPSFAHAIYLKFADPMCAPEMK